MEFKSFWFIELIVKTSCANSYDCGFIPLVGGYRSTGLGGGSHPKNSYFVSSSWVGAKFPLCANLANVDLCNFMNIP